jgi:L-ascorbate metabolism protein UlaG (beta-lactamase superfamily)
MGPEDAARAAAACAASAVVPIHWGEPHASLEDVERIRDLFDGEVHILEREA